MTAIQQAEALLAKMSAGEKVQLLHLIAQELANSTPGIVQSPDVCGGEPRIAGTRISARLTLTAPVRRSASTRC